jgi:hypothetical protein
MGGGEFRPTSRADCATAVMPALKNGAPWRVVDMHLLGDRAMQVRFVDGVEGVVRFGPNFYSGVFAHLIDTDRFAEARVEMGAVTWPGELDLAPDRMHDDIVANGECVLGAEAL